MTQTRTNLACLGALLATAAVMPVFAQDQKGATPTTVTINQLEENRAMYAGKTVRVSGEVQEVLGPRLFTIDEREWVDFDGETLVFVPAPLAALVREDSSVTVTGTVRAVTKAEIEREWGVFDVTPELEVELQKRTAIVADSITNTTDGRALTMRIGTGPAMAGANDHNGPMVSDLSMLARSNDTGMVGRHVNVQNARVASVAKDGGGFWVTSGEDHLFVLPAMATATKVTAGQTVSIEGVVMEMPSGMYDRLADKSMKMAHGEQIYVYAREIKDMR